MTHRYFLCVVMIVLIVSAALFSFSFLKTDAATTTQELPVATRQLLDKSVFGENEQTLEMIHPRFTDGSTNIIFFIDNAPQYFAESIAHNGHLLSDYFDPPLGVGKYILVEYSNDGGNFGCSGFSSNDCVADPHFISKFSFEVTVDQTPVPVAIAATTTLATTTTATTTATNKTAIFPSILNGILDFFGINTETTGATTTPATDATAASSTAITTSEAFFAPFDPFLHALIIATTTPLTDLTATSSIAAETIGAAASSTDIIIASSTSAAISIATSTATSATTSLTNQESAAQDAATTTQTIPQVIAPPLPENVPAPAVSTTTPVTQGAALFIAAAGLLGVKMSRGFAAIVIIGILFLLTRVLSGKDKKTKRR